MAMDDRATIDFVRKTAESERYRTYLRDILIELVQVDTVARGDIVETARREARLFDVIEREARATLGDSAEIERVPLSAAVASDPHYALPGYAADARGTIPPPEVVYAGRSNLVIRVPGSARGSSGVILHAHVDVVPPWFGAGGDAERVTGRGACDNKAQIAGFLAQMKLLRELEEKTGFRPARDRVYQFTIDEEIGGNGSVALAGDPRFAGWPVLMGECTDLVPYCAHRGCVYYRCRLSSGQNPTITALELFPFVVMALESEGRKLKRETDCPGFSESHVQTNHGVLGCYGDHPGNVCDHVAVDLTAQTNGNADRMAMKLVQAFDEVMAEYVKRYGDKTRETDAATGKPKVARHFDVKVLPAEEGQHLQVDVYGKSGHMGAIGECDNAITKTAMLFAALLKMLSKYPNFPGQARLADVAEDDRGDVLVLEGGQGFTPTHRMADVQARMEAAARDAVKKYCMLLRRKYDDSMVQMSFDRLRNDAYADAPDSAPMQALRSACAAVDHPVGDPVAWSTSCDARIYHHKGHAVGIFGAGELHVAHSDAEYVRLADAQKSLAISTLATLELCS